MKFFLALMGLCLSPLFSFSQIYNPVSWEQHSIRIDKDHVDVVFVATVDEGWYIYSQYLEGEDGPIPTSFNFDEAEKIGDNVECDLNRKRSFDKLFDMELVKYSHKAIFRQRIKATESTSSLTGYLEFMTCDDTKCLPPAQIDFKIDLTKSFHPDDIDYTADALCENQVRFVMQSEEDAGDGGSLDHVLEATAMTDDPVEVALTSESTHKAQALDDIQATDEQNSSIQISFAGEVESPDASESMNSTNQILEPVIWTPQIKKTGHKTWLIEMKADIEAGWQIYSHQLEGDDGPIPTTIALEEGSSYRQVGDLQESSTERVTEYDPFFEMTLTKLKKDATMGLEVESTGKDGENISGFLEYMACNDEKCLPPTFVDFVADPKALTIQAGDDLTSELPPAVKEGDLIDLESMFGLSFDALQDPVGACVEKLSPGRSLMGIFILGFIGGLIALLTPCVFPMIPLTVSFFTKSSEKKGTGLFNAVFYGFSIFLVYVLLSLPFHLLDTVNPNILNDISTNVWLNILFFLIFLAFAFSFFGYFDLTLPPSVTNRVSAAEGLGGILGVFFMAITLALVSFSCTGPILGSLLAGSLTGEGGAWQLSSGFAGFGLALGLPFGLFAAFPSMMNKLPKSGGWLNTVKVTLGFIELALAFKFLSNADMVKQWGLLKIEPFLIIWAIIAFALAIYLFGKLKFPHDSPIQKLSPGRLGLGVLTLVFAFYLLSGFRSSEMTGSYQPLSLLSGLAPPVCYSVFNECKCPQGLECYKDLQSGLAHARETNKPVLIDFTGHACVNCRKMEEHVWPEPEVYKYLRDDYVLISLYVDEKIELPEEEKVTLPRKSGGSIKMRYTGNRWAYFQTEYFHINSQPFYVLMTPDGQLLNNPVSYTPDKHEYAEFLECGLQNYNQLGLR